VESPDVALKLLAKIEIRTDGSNEAEWKQLTTVPIISDYEKVFLKSTNDIADISDIRIVLCLQSNDSWCGYEHLVKMDSVYTRETRVLSTDHLMAVILVAGLCALVVVSLLLCCCWKRRDNNNKLKKDYEMDAPDGRNSSKVNTISQPFYPNGHDNKGKNQ
jgi:hypothetical protein